MLCASSEYFVGGTFECDQLHSHELRAAKGRVHRVFETTSGIGLEVWDRPLGRIAHVFAVTQRAVRRGSCAEGVVRLLRMGVKRTDRVDRAAISARKPDREAQRGHRVE